MWIVNWFMSALQSLHLVKKKAKIVFFGLDNAGKSTLLLRLKQGHLKQLQPTMQPHCEEIKVGNVNIKAWDLGGHEAARKTWRNYTMDIDGIVYLVDASNKQRFEETKIQLMSLLDIDQIQGVPIVVLGNKIDKAGAVPDYELKDCLELEEAEGKEKRPIKLFMCSVSKKIGYDEAFSWLTAKMV